METREGPRDLPVTQASARAMLAEIADCNREMAARMRAPWWYHVAVGGMMGSLCFSPVLPLPWQFFPLALFGAGGWLLVRAYVRRTGAWVSGYRAGRTRWVGVGVAVIEGLAYMAALIMVSRPWLVAVIALAVAIAVSMAGWIWEAAYRRDLKESA